MSFHIPEMARNTTHPRMWSSVQDGCNGAFDVNSPQPGWRLGFIVSDGMGWEHVSVIAYRERGLHERQTRLPTWTEMCAVKSLCWDEEDVVVQIHPKRSEYVNQHPQVLHLWRPTAGVMPVPDGSGAWMPTPGPDLVGANDPNRPISHEMANEMRAREGVDRVVRRGGG